MAALSNPLFVELLSSDPGFVLEKQNHCFRARIPVLPRTCLLFFKQGDTKLVKAQLLIFLAWLTLEFICTLNKYIWTLRKVFKDLKWRIFI